MNLKAPMLLALSLAACPPIVDVPDSGAPSLLRLDVVGPAEVLSTEDTTVSLLGFGFKSPCVVLLGGRALGRSTVLSPAVVTVVVPRGTRLGTYDVTLVNGDGERVTAAQALTVVEPSATDGGSDAGMDAGVVIEVPLGWQAGAVVPGYVLSGPSGGRSDVRAVGTWAQGRWTVRFTRSLTTVDPLDDVQFSGLATGATYSLAVAVLDNTVGALDATMRGQHAAAYRLGNEASTADLKAKSVTAAPTSSPTDPGWGAPFVKPAGDAGLGTATGAAVTLRAAYDSANVYLLAEWDDATESALKESWVYDGATWARRPASTFDEDRLAIFWDISVPDFATRGCGALCHPVRMGVETDAGPGVINADLWHWKAARTNPMGFADDQRLTYGVREGRLMAYRADDLGAGMETANTRATDAGPRPLSMPESAPDASATFLFSWPPGSGRAVPLVGTFPTGAELPGFTLGPPAGGRSELRTTSSWANGRWTVLFRRALRNAWTTDDVQLDALAAGATYRFSVAVLDNAGGANDATMTSQNVGPHTLGNEASTADLKARNAALPPTANPADPGWGPSFTKPGGSGIPGTVTGSAVELRAAYDATSFYLLATWSDPTESIRKESWRFDGTRWVRRSARGTDNSWATIGADDDQWDEDRLAIFWDISVPGFDTRGCGALCHPTRMGIETDAGPGVINADLWHWKAARTAPMGFADDQRLTWGVRDGKNMAYRADDLGTGIEQANTVTVDGGALPAFASETPATFLFRAPASGARAIGWRP
ncbi:MAG: hypothetical protein JNJ54_12225 [Myxococcaceae bacterium]|nr:hypothetical protein [Myxococcaceae bacterium]